MNDTEKTGISAWPVWAKIGLPVVILAIIAAVVLFATGVIGPGITSQTGNTVPDGQVMVPDVVGKSLGEAEKLLYKNGLKYVIKDKVENDMPAGTVILQDPDASNITDAGSTIELILSDGKGKDRVVDVTGRPLEEAKVLLEESGYTVKVKEEESKEVAPGSVISQSVESGEEKGTEITLVVSTGSKEIDTSKVVKVPNLMEKSYEEAIKELSKKNLYYTKEEVYNASLPANTIIGMNPGAGEEVKAGTIVKLTVNLGAKTIVLKDYSYKTLDSAKAELEAQGLKVSVEYDSSKTVKSGTIISHKPASGTTVKEGSTVVLTVSKGYTVTVPDVKNMKLDKAQEKLAECGLASNVLKYEVSATVAEGKVISQSVKAKEKVELGTLVGLVVSAGPTEKETEKEEVPVTLASLSVSSKPTKTTYYVGDSFSKSGLKVTAKYSDGTTKDVTSKVTLSSPDMSKSGTKTVTVSYEDKTTNFVITVKSIKISLNKTSLSIKDGETGKLTATTTPSGCDVSWKSSNTSVATVSADGTVTGKAPGNVTITATIKRGSETKQATCSVSVTAETVHVAGVTISEESKELKVGSSFELTATITPTNATNQKVTWSSSNKDVATVSSTGKVTAKAAGTAKITVKTDDGGYTDVCNVTVAKAKLSSIEVTTKPSKTTYNVNDTLSTSGMVVTATYSDGSTAKVTGYKCSPEKLTTAGTQTIKVSYKEDSVEKTTTFTVTVNAKIETYTLKVVSGDGISGVNGGGTYKAGDSVTISATVKSGYKFNKWTSSNTSLVPNGTNSSYTFKMPAGNVTLTASATKTATSSHRVTLTVTPDKTSVSRGDVITYTVTMDSKEALASMAFTTIFPKGLEYVDNSGEIDANAKSTLGFDAVDWTEWSLRIGFGKGENYVNGYASAGKTFGSVKLCTFKVKVSDTAAKGEYVVKLTGLDEFMTSDFEIINESDVYVDSIPVKVS